MESGEAESLSLFRAGWYREFSPQAKEQLSGHSSVGAADDDIPHHLPKQGVCPGPSAA